METKNTAEIFQQKTQRHTKIAYRIIVLVIFLGVLCCWDIVCAQEKINLTSKIIGDHRRGTVYKKIDFRSNSSMMIKVDSPKNNTSVFRVYINNHVIDTFKFSMIDGLPLTNTISFSNIQADRPVLDIPDTNSHTLITIAPVIFPESEQLERATIMTKVLLTLVFLFLSYYLFLFIRYHLRLRQYYAGRKIALELFKEMKESDSPLTFPQAIALVAADKIDFKIPKQSFDEVISVIKDMTESKKEKDKKDDDHKCCCVQVCCCCCKNEKSGDKKKKKGKHKHEGKEDTDEQKDENDNSESDI